jgi:BirA family biotin operon repressor/biotin-[acetyl-CoA-carboxylase] ligase
LQNNTFSGLFIGQNFVRLPSVDSTNNYLKKELSKSTPLPEGTVIMADNQFAGRGQVNNTWVSESGKNLTFSILLNPSFLAPHQQFKLNKTVSVAINDSLRSIIGERVKIKWPNDIFIEDYKLGGVLIENIIQGSNWKHAIVGIGLNINQIDFPDCLKNVTSLNKISGKEYDVNIILRTVCHAIERAYLFLRTSASEKVDIRYQELLYRLNENHFFRINGEEQLGKIIGVDESGLLIVDFLGIHRTFGFKEIEYVI